MKISKKITGGLIGLAMVAGLGLGLSNTNKVGSDRSVQGYYTPSTTYEVSDTSAELTSYYSSISDGLTGDDLLSALQDLNAEKRQTTVGYKKMGTSTEGAFIYTDYDMDSVATDDNGQKYGTNIASFYTKTSVSSGLNREHVWPNSHGGNLVEADILMTRPTISSENSSRGNSFYVEGMNSTSAGWDPYTAGYDAEMRGECARIILYCIVADSTLGLSAEDSHETSNANPDYLMGNIHTLIKWHFDHIPNVYEMNRNNGAEYLQGNRNPFVDHPEYVAEIWGDFDSTVADLCDTYSSMYSNWVPGQCGSYGSNTAVEYSSATGDTNTSSSSSGGSSSTTVEGTSNTWTATSGAIAGSTSGTIENGDFDWSFTRSSVVYTGWTSSAIQIGKKGGPEDLTLTNNNFPGTIKSVAVECASYQGAHTISISVGGTEYLAATATSSWTTLDTKTGSGSSSGEIVITFTPGSRALYIKSITVVYEEDSSATTYTITYDANGGSGTMTATTGTSPEVVDCTFTAPDGKQFAGWNSSSDGNGTDYAVGAVIQADITLYAIWEDEEVTPSGEETTITGNIATIADENGWVNGTAYTSFMLDAVVTISTTGSGNSGKYYTSGENWRLYQVGSGNVIVSVADNYYLTSITFTFSVEDTGILLDGSDTVTSGTAVSISDSDTTSKEFTVGNSGSVTNGKIKITNISVTYVSVVTTDGATTFAETFLSAITCDSTGVTALTFTSGYSWEVLKTEFTALDSADQTTLHDASADVSGTTIEQAMARYDYIVAKYGTTTYENFIGRSVSSNAKFVLKSLTSNPTNGSLPIILVAVLAVTASSFLIFYKKKKSR